MIAALWTNLFGLFGAASLTDVAALAAATVLVALLAVALRRAGRTLAPRPVPVRVRPLERTTRPPRLCDPDAAGRPRPRAPTPDRTA